MVKMDESYASINSSEMELDKSGHALRQEKPAEAEVSWLRAQLLAVLYGVVATAMAAPVMMSFASIIFSDVFFAPFLPHLVKLVVCSAAVHQICYVCSSTMAFAVGQVQDAGLIFLSAMARLVVHDAEVWRRAARGAADAVEGVAAAAGGDRALERAAGGVHGGGLVADLAAKTSVEATLMLSDEVVVATALWLLGIATAALGFMLIVIGKLRLASLAQYLPVPVVGGYLAYIGFYCGQAGLAMMADEQLIGLGDWPKLFNEAAAARILVGVCVCLAIKLAGALAKKHHWSRATAAGIIPGTLCLTMAIFYAGGLVFGYSLEDAREGGWVGKKPAVAAADVGGTTGGWRDIAVLKPWTLYFPNATPSDMSSVFLGLGRLLPQVLPNWLAMVCVVAFSSSLDVAAIEMELGRPLDYDSELQTVGLGNLVSGGLGGFSGSYIFSQTILNMRGGVANRLSGLVVFGLEIILVFGCPTPPTAFCPTGAFGGLLLLICLELTTEWLWHARRRFSFPEYAVCVFTFCAIQGLGLESGFAAGLVAAGLAFACSYATPDGGGVSIARSSGKGRSVAMRDFEQRLCLSRHSEKIKTLDLKGFVFFGTAATLLARLKAEVGVFDDDPRSTRKRRGASPGTSVEEARYLEDGARPLEFWVVLDCVDFAGVDATAVRACFVPFVAALKRTRGKLLFSGLKADVLATLEGHGVAFDGGDGASSFDDRDAALESAEDALLRRYHEKPGLQPRLDSFHELAGDDDRGLRDILGDYLASRPCVRAGDRRRAETATDSEAFAAEAHRLSSYFSRTTVDQGATLFDAGDDAANIYFVQNGTVDLSVKKSKARPARRIMRVKRGAVLGELMFLLKQEQTLTATAATHTDLWTLGRAAHARMRDDDPKLFTLLQTALLKSMALQVEESLATGEI